MSENSKSEKKLSKNVINRGITKLTLKGYKSFINECTIDIMPMTILAGTNSSGKSSIMQPLLLMKQTLEESYDPGTLLLNGPNVRFTSTDQILSASNNNKLTDSFSVGIEVNRKKTTAFTFEKLNDKPGFQLKEMKVILDGDEEVFTPNMTEDELLQSAPKSLEKYKNDGILFGNDFKNGKLSLIKERFILRIGIQFEKFRFSLGDRLEFENNLYSMLHLPGLRGNPERNYPTTATESELGSRLPGTFEKYVASIITQWQNSSSKKKIRKLENALNTLKLTTRIKTKQINDTEVGIFIARSNSESVEDFVSIADVGLGVSQTLPILVALIYAKPGQMIFIEQPEIHLHPRAQYNLAILLADAAKRGVKVVVETHSSLLIKGIQTQIANEILTKEQVALHWFSRSGENGATSVNRADLDEFGTFGDWPEDFDDVALEAEMNYLNAVEKRSYKE